MLRWWRRIFRAKMAWILRVGGVVLRVRACGLWELRRGCVCFGLVWRGDGWMVGVFRFLWRDWGHGLLRGLKRRRFYSLRILGLSLISGTECCCICGMQVCWRR